MDALTFVRNHLRFEKGINVATVNEALDAAASMIAELAGATVLASFQRVSLDTSDVEVSSTLADVNRVLEQNFHTLDVEDTVVLALVLK